MENELFSKIRKVTEKEEKRGGKESGQSINIQLHCMLMM